jgi:hypothetical protein
MIHQIVKALVNITSPLLLAMSLPLGAARFG